MVEHASTVAPDVQTKHEKGNPVKIDQLKRIKDYNGYDLSRLADCFTPDAPDSPGALFLVGVRDALVEMLEGRFEDYRDGDWDNVFTSLDNDGSLNEITQDASSFDHATHQGWLEFVDLGAYQDTFSSDCGSGDASERADVALIHVGEALIQAIRDEVESYEDDEDDEDE